jgi:hypothetical protein
MKQTVTQMNDKDPDLDEMPTNCDFSDGEKVVVGKYADRIAGNTRLVRLDPDVALLFPNADAVNAALRSLSMPDTSVDG